LTVAEERQNGDSSVEIYAAGSASRDVEDHEDIWSQAEVKH